MMRAFLMLVKRNMNMYLRNKTSVLFSSLSMIIILVLNAVFLESVNEQYLAKFITLDPKEAAYMIGSWLMAGIMIVNIVMVSMATLSIMVEDEEKHKMAAFLVSPISRMTLNLSYVVAACMNAFLLTLLTIIFSEVYLYMSCGAIFSVVTLIKLVGVIMANIFSAVTFFICLATLTKTSSAFSSITTAVGTLIGFIAAIYLPMGNLSNHIQGVLKLFPVLYGTSAARMICTQEAVKQVFEGAPSQMVKDYQSFMGITINWGKQEVSMLGCLMILMISGILFIGIADILLKVKKSSDR